MKEYFGQSNSYSSRFRDDERGLEHMTKVVLILLSPIGLAAVYYGVTYLIDRFRKSSASEGAGLSDVVEEENDELEFGRERRPVYDDEWL